MNQVIFDVFKAHFVYHENFGCYLTEKFGGEVHLSISLCTTATKTITVIAPKNGRKL